MKTLGVLYEEKSYTRYPWKLTFAFGLYFGV